MDDYSIASLSESKNEWCARLVNTLTPAIIAGLKSRAGILLIEHDMDAVFQLADRVTVIVEGGVIASGPPDAISADSAVREAYLGSEEHA